eukprot:6461376-Amphidinium_carterae.1
MLSFEQLDRLYHTMSKHVLSGYSVLRVKCLDHLLGAKEQYGESHRGAFISRTEAAHISVAVTRAPEVECKVCNPGMRTE